MAPVEPNPAQKSTEADILRKSAEADTLKYGTIDRLAVDALEGDELTRLALYNHGITRGHHSDAELRAVIRKLTGLRGPSSGGEPREASFPVKLEPIKAPFYDPLGDSIQPLIKDPHDHALYEVRFQNGERYTVVASNMPAAIYKAIATWKGTGEGCMGKNEVKECRMVGRAMVANASYSAMDGGACVR